MFEILKIVHLLSLLAGGAAAIGGAVLMRRVAATGGPPPEIVRSSMSALSNMGFGAIIVLWLTGLPMAFIAGSFNPTNWAFALKLVAAAAVLIISPAMFVLRVRAAQAGKAPDMVLMGRLARAVRIAVILAIVLAVLAFN